MTWHKRPITRIAQFEVLDLDKKQQGISFFSRLKRQKEEGRAVSVRTSTIHPSSELNPQNTA